MFLFAISFALAFSISHFYPGIPILPVGIIIFSVISLSLLG